MSRLERAAIFVSFEGIDGCGKSTLLAQLSTWLDAAGIPHIRTREPGGTALGEAARSMVLDSSFSGMHPWSEALIYAAGRAQHVFEVIMPALEAGQWVLSDRFADATLAYQGYGRGLDPRCLRDIHRWSAGDLWPHVTVLLDCAVETAMERRDRRPSGPDRLERQDTAFHQRVRNGYLELATTEPDRFVMLDASQSLAHVIENFRALFQQRLNLDLPQFGNGPCL